ncbi:MAG TPA: isoprenylcysteine carboxylmethyltransferase family protein [Candidatus Acidoferrales bacterium]|nr:isoprenylcysteine carboxylmethyltransferase family protein [Candidatus Acidoferrales bacterium]
MSEAAGDESLLLILLKLAVFTLLVPGTVTVWLPLFALFPEVRHRPIDWSLATAAAIALIAIGTAGYLWCALDFAVLGRGTPAPIDMPKRLVVRGPYKYSRNPMYISVLTALMGEAALFRSVVLVEYAVGVAICFHLFVLIQEEPTLRRKMGDSYARYCEEVPRWFPRIAPGRRKHAV